MWHVTHMITSWTCCIGVTIYILSTKSALCKHKKNMSHLQPNKAKECVARTGLLELGVKKKKIQINTNPDDRTKLRGGSSVQWAHLPTQGVMECSAFGLSVMCSANKCVQLLPVSLRLNPGQSLLTANIFLKYCWPTTNMTCDIWSASARPALTSLPGALSPLT